MPYLQPSKLLPDPWGKQLASMPYGSAHILHNCGSHKGNNCHKLDVHYLAIMAKRLDRAAEVSGLIASMIRGGTVTMCCRVFEHGWTPGVESQGFK
jgi:hypothetical protein